MFAGTHPIPVELIKPILEFAARNGLNDDPQFAASLQLISTQVRQWLLPVVYYALCIWVPESNCSGGSDPSPSKSMLFFLRLIAHPDALPRRYVRHIGFHGADLRVYRPTFARAMKHNTDVWHLDSIAINLSLSVFRRIIPVLGARQVFESTQSPRSVPIGIVAARAANRKNGEGNQREVTAAIPLIQSLRVRLLPAHLDAEEFASTLTRARSGLSYAIWNLPLFDVPRADLVVQVEIEADQVGEVHAFYEQLARMLQVTLEFAAAHGVSVIFEIPTPSATVQTRAEESEAAVFLAALEIYLRSRPTGSTHRVSVQYRDNGSRVPRSVQDYLCLVRLGYTFESAVGTDVAVPV